MTFTKPNFSQVLSVQASHSNQMNYLGDFQNEITHIEQIVLEFYKMGTQKKMVIHNEHRTGVEWIGQGIG